MEASEQVNTPYFPPHPIKQNLDPERVIKNLLHSLSAGAVYICTEDAFPSRRLQQLIQEQPHLRCKVPLSLIRSLHFSDHIYVEHAGDLVGIAKKDNPRTFLEKHMAAGCGCRMDGVF